MDAEKLAALKRHCHIDFDDDDAQLLMLYGSAVGYLAGAGVPATMQSDERYLLAAYSLVNEWYDGAAIGTCTVGLRQLINQLKMEQIASAGTGL